MKSWGARLNIPMRKASMAFVALAIIIAVLLYLSELLVTRGYLRMEEASERYNLSVQSATNLEMGSETLTEAVRCFVVTEDIKYLEDYFEEAEVVRTRDKAVSGLRSLLGDEDSAALGYLTQALDRSNALMELEYRAMLLTLAPGDYGEKRIPDTLKKVSLTPVQEAMSPEEKHREAVELVFGAEYMDYKTQIRRGISLCTQELIDESYLERIQSGERMNRLLTAQTILTVVLLIVVILAVVFINNWIRRPLSRMVEQMRAKGTVDAGGAEELRFVTETYNTIFEENRRTHEQLTYKNMHDPLTGLLNRNAYNIMRNELDMSQCALLMVDVDKFKTINDTYGHDVGDLVLKRVADVLKYSFRASDKIFRLGGDEFVVIMVNVSSALRDLVKTKIEQANVMLQQPGEDLPPVSISVGAAFADRENPEGDIFKDADTALYRVKESGRRGCYIY